MSHDSSHQFCDVCWLDSEAFCKVNHSKQGERRLGIGGHCWPKQIRRVHFILEDQMSMFVQEHTSPAVLWGRENAFQ